MVVVVVMGVCGCGKTTIGEALAERLGWSFRDADEFHSEANKHKMSTSTPLTDEDRLPWLKAIHQYIKSLQEKSESAVVTCSALKRHYRDVLRSGEHFSSPSSSSSSSADILFVLLKGTRYVLEERLGGRKGHFMPSDLLTSQLDTLEEPDPDENCLIVNIDDNVPHMVDLIADKIKSKV
ncbi:probable gluconokinase [Littorina saxatilis]|uniref:probable gluconokinase n=1 Tax=Littorina saxatilis TaxID=31220 RepID=UPI0038B67D27